MDTTIYNPSPDDLPTENSEAALAERLMSLFAGLDRAYGQAWIPAKRAPSERPKVEAVYSTVHERLTVGCWERHLTGKIGLGVFPLRDDGTIRFGALDLDIYPLDPAPILADVRQLRLPLIPCRSKSGGAHWYVFFRDDVPAALAQTKLRNWAAALGHPDSEVFPKQRQLGEGRDGNYINAPYFGKYSLRYAYGDDGKALDIEVFLDLAERMRVTAAELEAWPTLPPVPRSNVPNHIRRSLPTTDAPTDALTDAPTIEEDFGEHEGAGFEGVGDDDLWHGVSDEDWRKIAHGPGHGERHNAVKRLAALIFGFAEPTLAEVLVRLFAYHQCDPPFGLKGKEKAELNDLIRWVAKREARNG